MPDDRPYRVSWSRKAVEAVKEMRRRAAGSGRQADLVRVVKATNDRLRRDPLTLGEVYRSRGAIEERLAVHEFLAADFAVDRVRRFVLVRACSPIRARRATSWPGLTSVRRGPTAPSQCAKDPVSPLPPGPVTGVRSGFVSGVGGGV